MPVPATLTNRIWGGFPHPLCAADTGMPTIMVYDGYEGGAGLAATGFNRFAEIVRMTHELITECSCESGCPPYIFSPKCGSMNQPLDKAGAAALLGMMCTTGKSPADDGTSFTCDNTEQITSLSCMHHSASGTP